jgi:hypothetical protein
VILPPSVFPGVGQNEVLHWGRFWPYPQILDNPEKVFQGENKPAYFCVSESDNNKKSFISSIPGRAQAGVSLMNKFFVDNSVT